MNDLNLMVSHALSAVREAQQSVSEGEMSADENAQALLSDFSDVMQGLIALAQTAPKTEDAFDYANTALLQNLAKGENDVEALELVAEIDGEGERAEAVAGVTDSDTVEMLEDADEPLPGVTFPPLADTLAAMLLPPSLQPVAQTGVEPAVDAAPTAGARPVSEAADTNRALLAEMARAQARAEQAAQPQRTSEQTFATVRTAAAQLAAAPSAAPSESGALSASLQQAIAALANDQPSKEVQATAQSQAPTVGVGEQDVTQVSSPGLDALDASPHASASPDRNKLAVATELAAPQQRDIAPQPAAETAPQAPDVAAATRDLQAADARLTVAAQPDAGTAQNDEPSQDDVKGDNAVKGSAAAQAAHPGRAADAVKAQNAKAGDKGPALGAANGRQVTTIAERQAARNVQNYSRAMADAPPPSTSAAPAAVSGGMVTQFAPPVAGVVTPLADPTTTVQLPNVSLQNLPTDLSNAMAAGAKRVRIEINPPALGSVEVGVHMRDGAVFVSMQAENAHVAQHIERHVQDLRANLKDAGLSLGGFEMSSRGDAAGQNASHSGASSQERLWSDDMLQLAMENTTATAALDEISTPVMTSSRPGGINVVA